MLRVIYNFDVICPLPMADVICSNFINYFANNNHIA